MLPVSVCVLVPFAYFAWGRPLSSVVEPLLSDLADRKSVNSQATIAFGFVAGVCLASVPQIRSVTRYLATMVHELGHAFVAGVLGATPKTISIHVDGSGLAVYESDASWHVVRRVGVSLAGYPAPAIAALAALRATDAGYSRVWLSFVAVTLVVGLGLFVRTRFTFLVMALMMGTTLPVVLFASPIVASVVVAVFAGVLLRQGVVDVLEQLRSVREHRGVECDAAAIGRDLHISAGFVASLHSVLVIGIGVIAVLDIAR